MSNLTPFASKAQLERFKKLVLEGVISQEMFDSKLAISGDIEKLPERLHPKKEEKKEKTE